MQCTFQSIVGWFLVNIFFLKSRIVLIYGLWEAHKTVVLYRVPIRFRHMTKHSKNLITESLGCLGKVWTDELANFHSHHILHFCDAHSHGRPACLWPSNCNSHRRHCWLGFTVGGVYSDLVIVCIHVRSHFTLVRTHAPIMNVYMFVVCVICSYISDVWGLRAVWHVSCCVRSCCVRSLHATRAYTPHTHIQTYTHTAHTHTHTHIHTCTQMSGRLFMLDSTNHTWRERGRGELRLNDTTHRAGDCQSRLGKYL